MPALSSVRFSKCAIHVHSASTKYRACQLSKYIVTWGINTARPQHTYQIVQYLNFMHLLIQRPMQSWSINQITYSEVSGVNSEKIRDFDQRREVLIILSLLFLYNLIEFYSLENCKETILSFWSIANSPAYQSIQIRVLQ